MAQRGNVNRSTIERYIRDADFPCSKEELIDQARNNDAPREVLEALRNLSEEDFDNKEDLMRDIEEAR